MSQKRKILQDEYTDELHTSKSDKVDKYLSPADDNCIDLGDFHFWKHELYVLGISLLVLGLHFADLLQDELA